MKKITLLICLTLISAILVSCESNNNTALKSDKPESELKEDSDTFNLNGKITEVIINGLHVSDSGVTVSENKDFIKLFRSILLSAEKEKGVVNMAEPDYKVYLDFENKSKQIFDLWLGEKGQKSTLMKNDDTHTVYTVSDEMTDKLIDLIK